jgi:hypothetical protein
MAPRVSSRARVQAQQKIVTIAFDADTMKGRLESFTEALGASAWWRSTTAEYCTPGSSSCVGPTAVLAHVTLHRSPPAYLSAVDVEDFLQQLISDGSVPPPQDDAVYILLFPASVKLGMPGFESCREFDGYHGLMRALVPNAPASTDGGAELADAEASDAGPYAEAGIPASDGGGVTPTKVAYAVQARCAGGEAETTTGIAHELIEVATDPDGLGYNVDDPAWGAFFYSEVGDLCDYEPHQTMGADFQVQSGWSNAAAKAGQNPCVPQVSGDVYFNAAPEAARISLQVGQSTTVAVMPFSTATTPDWKLEAVDLATLYGAPPALSVSLDRSTVHNGLPATLTIKLLRQPDPLPTGQRAAVLSLVSTQGAQQRFWPMLIVPKP